MKIKDIGQKLFVGWQEWCQLPELGIPLTKAKIDTGARTSAIHAYNIKTYSRHNKTFVHFEAHPIQRNDQIIVDCKAEVIDERVVMSSTGHKENRLVILTPITLGDTTWDIELTLSNREPLRHRVLLGREALRHHVLIDPSSKLLQGRIPKAKLAKLYNISPKIL